MKISRVIFILLLLGLWASGVAWLVYKLYFPEPEIGSNFAPRLLKIHAAFALLFLPAIGTLYEHIKRGVRLRRNLSSGILMLSLVALTLITAWGLYYLADEEARALTSTIHWVAGGIFPFVIILHRWLARQTRP